MSSQQYVWYFFTYIHPRWGCFACIIKWTKGLFGLLAWPILPLQWEPMNRLWISFYQSSKVVAVLNVALFLHRNSQFKVSTRPIRQHQNRICLILGKRSIEKRTFSFGHCPNYLTPTPWPQFGQLGPLFSEVEIQDLKVSLELRILYILYNILYICNLKTVKSSIHWHFWRNRLFLLTKNALLKRVPKNSLWL